MTAASALWHGEALTGLDSEWALTERDQPHQERLAAKHELADTRLRVGQGEELLHELSACVTTHPLDERVAGQYTLALSRAGSPPTPSRTTGGCGRGTGTDSDAPLQKLHQRILGTEGTTVNSPVTGSPPIRTTSHPLLHQGDMLLTGNRQSCSAAIVGFMRIVRRIHRLPQVRTAVLVTAVLLLAGLAVYGAVTDLDKGEKIASLTGTTFSMLMLFTSVLSRQDGTATRAQPQLARYGEYPVRVEDDGRLSFDTDHAPALAKRVIAEKDTYAAYEFLWLIDGVRAVADGGDEPLDPVLVQRLRKLVPTSTRRELDAERQAVLDTVTTVLRGVATAVSGCGVELVLHDTRNPMESIVAIHGSITKRALRASSTNVVIEMIRQHGRHTHVSSVDSYLNRNRGKKMKSSTIPITDRDGRLVAVMCINIDISWSSDVENGFLTSRLKELLRALARVDLTQEVSEKFVRNR